MKPLTFINFLFGYFVLFLLFYPSTAAAQTPSPAPNPDAFTAAKSLSDFNYTFEKYREAHSTFVVARNEYFTYGTLTAQQKALEATRNMMIWRADVIKTYLLALKQKMLETPGITPADYLPLGQMVDLDVNWVLDQKSYIPSAATLPDLTKISQDLENKYPEINRLYYQILIQILCGKELELRQKVETQFLRIKVVIGDLKSKGTQTDVLERWLLEAQTRIDRAKENHQRVLSILSKISSGNNQDTTNYASSYTQAQSLFAEENLYLNQTIDQLNEIIRVAAQDGI